MGERDSSGGSEVDQLHAAPKALVMVSAGNKEPRSVSGSAASTEEADGGLLFVLK